MRRVVLGFGTLLASIAPASAAALDGASLSLLWVVPFAGLLLTIALGPLLFPKLWHHHYGKFAFFWAALTLLPLAIAKGPAAPLRPGCMPCCLNISASS